MTKSKVEEFHISFIRNLAFVGLVTIVSMISTRYLLTNYMSATIKTHSYTTQESQIKPD